MTPRAPMTPQSAALQLRQVALVARGLEEAARELCLVLGLRVGFRDPGVAEFGLDNVVIPIGDTFLEVVSPHRVGTAAGRYLERRGGDGGYMVLLQVPDMEAARARLAGLGIRVVWRADHLDMQGTHLHPKDTGGALLSLDRPVPPDEWRWAGPGWRAAVDRSRVAAIAGVELQSERPEELARRWAAIVERPVERAGDGWAVPLDRGVLRFVLPRDGRGEGLATIELAARDRAAVLAAARDRGARVAGDEIELVGMRFRLLSTEQSS